MGLHGFTANGVSSAYFCHCKSDASKVSVTKDRPDLPAFQKLREYMRVLEKSPRISPKSKNEKKSEEEKVKKNTKNRKNGKIVGGSRGGPPSGPAPPL